MYKPESIQENETHKCLLDFEIQTDHQIPSRRPNLVIVDKKKKNIPNCALSHLGQHEGDSDTNCNLCT